MKTMKRLLVMLVLILSVLSVPAQAAAKKGLVNTPLKKSNMYQIRDKKSRKLFGTYSFYKAGKPVKNKWKTVKGNKYYFGKKGVAYKANPTFDKTIDVKVFRIKGKKYGFDSCSHLVGKGIYGTSARTLLVFDEKGMLDQAATDALHAKIPSKIGTTVRDDVISLFGKPLKEDEAKSCGPSPWDASFGEGADALNRPVWDVSLFYEHFRVDLIYNKDNGEYHVEGFSTV